MEIVEKDGKLDGRIQPRGGAVRPIVAARVENGHLLITVQATGRGPEIDWDLIASSTKFGEAISGVQKQGENAETKIAGVRAPKLDRTMPQAWTPPEPLFNGKDLTGWEPVNNPVNSKWVAKDGTLFNSDRGSNIRTTKTFQDFKLHIEVNCPEHCNSGIYLRAGTRSRSARKAAHSRATKWARCMGSSLRRWICRWAQANGSCSISRWSAAA